MSSSSKSSSSSFKKGDRVSWEFSGGTVEGEVQEKLTSTTHIKSHAVNATEDEPQFLVKSDKTGALAAHKPEALTRLD